MAGIGEYIYALLPSNTPENPELQALSSIFRQKEQVLQKDLLHADIQYVIDCLSVKNYHFYLKNTSEKSF